MPLIDSVSLRAYVILNPVQGNLRNNRLPVTSKNDILTGQKGNDVLTGLAGDDQIIGGMGKDTLGGGTGGDRFIYSGRNQRAAFKQSTFATPDQITDLMLERAVALSWTSTIF